MSHHAMTDEVAQLEKQIGELKSQLSEARRRVPPEDVADAPLLNPDGSPTTLSALFGPHMDLLLVHNMGRKCVYCTLWADGFSSLTPHLTSRAAFVLCSPDEPAVLRDFAASRRWAFSTVSAHNSTFIRDMGFEPEPGKHWPGVSAFRKLPDGRIQRTGKAPFGPGDDFCAAWPFFDLLDRGSAGWEPKYSYNKPAHACSHCNCH